MQPAIDTFGKDARPASSRRRTIAAVAVVALAGAAVVGVAIASGPEGDGASPRYAQTLIPDLCAMRDTVAAPGRDASPARTMFFDRVHEPLHELARDLSTEDRTQAARLLEAKQVVESLLSRGSEPEASRDVDPLIAETIRGLMSLDPSTPAGCPGSAR